MTNPTDNCTCGHSAASHGFGYEGECVAGKGAGDTRDACPCAGFVLETPGEVFERNDGREKSENVVRASIPPSPADRPGAHPPPMPEGFWLARGGPEGAAAGMFPDELSALRFAVEHGLKVEYREWGEL